MSKRRYLSFQMSYSASDQVTSNTTSAHSSPSSISCPRVLRSPLLPVLASLQTLPQALPVNVIYIKILSCHLLGIFFIQQDRWSRLMVGKESAACLWWLLMSPARAAGASEGMKKEVCFSLGGNFQSQEGAVFIQDTRAAYFSRRQDLASMKLFLYSHMTPKM